MPARHHSWEPVVELSKRIVAGAGLTLDAERYEAPGFVVRTWEAWERLIYLALRSRLGHASVAEQQLRVWGSRGEEPINVKPDVILEVPGSKPRLVDAKYKTRLDRKKLRITQGDLMEASAFMAACDTERIVLVYPRSARDDVCPSGSTSVFDVATLVPGRLVIGVHAEARGFSGRNEHRRFAERLTAGVAAAHDAASPAVGDGLS